MGSRGAPRDNSEAHFCWKVCRNRDVAFFEAFFHFLLLHLRLFFCRRKLFFTYSSFCIHFMLILSDFSKRASRVHESLIFEPLASPRGALWEPRRPQGAPQERPGVALGSPPRPPRLLGGLILAAIYSVFCRSLFFSFLFTLYSVSSVFLF